MKALSKNLAFVTVAVASLLAAACGSGAVSAPVPQGDQARGDGGAVAKSKFQALIDRAKAADGRVRGSIRNYSSEQIRHMEQAFERQFGIKITLEDEPGQPSRDIPPKVIAAHKAGKGVIDYLYGSSPTNITEALRAGALGKPPWDELMEGWPIIGELKKLGVKVPGGPNNTTSEESCMFVQNGVWGPAYNKNKIKPEEIKDLKWDDLLADKWRGRVILQPDGSGGMSRMPFGKDWPLERVVAWARNLGANNPKLVAGGGTAMSTALIQGEGDIVPFLIYDLSYSLVQQGAPIGFAWPEFITGSDLITCFPAIPANNPSLAALFWGWWATDGQYELAAAGYGGARPLFSPEADKFPLGKIFKEAGITDLRVAKEKTLEEFGKNASNEQAITQALKAGVETGKKVPYPWGCAANHPSCVR